MISYRKATIGDASELARIRSIFVAEIADIHCEQERQKLEAGNKTYFDATLSDDSFVAWLALDGDKIVSTSGLSFYVVPPNHECHDGRVAYIMNIYTIPEYRKQGLGTVLFKKIVDEAKQRGYKKITLNATDIGKPLYEKYGFVDVIGDMVFYVE